MTVKGVLFLRYFLFIFAIVVLLVLIGLLIWGRFYREHYKSRDLYDSVKNKKIFILYTGGKKYGLRI